MKDEAATGLSRRGGLLTLAAVVLASCSSPNPKLYIFATLPGKTLHGAPAAIELRAISIAHYLERSQIGTVVGGLPPGRAVQRMVGRAPRQHDGPYSGAGA